jgi:hypothetical protein
VTDRLKAWLDEGYMQTYAAESEEKAVSALRAVVELHKPVMKRFRYTPEIHHEFCCECQHRWPCPTIRAIEKEVFGAD